MLGLIFLCVMPVLGTRVGDIGQDTKMPPAATLLRQAEPARAGAGAGVTRPISEIAVTDRSLTN